MDDVAKVGLEMTEFFLIIAHHEHIYFHAHAVLTNRGQQALEDRAL